MDNFEDYPFGGRKAKVFSYTQDNLAAVIDPPASVVLIEFEGGGQGVLRPHRSRPREGGSGHAGGDDVQEAAVRPGSHQLLLEGSAGKVKEEIDARKH